MSTAPLVIARRRFGETARPGCLVDPCHAWCSSDCRAFRRVLRRGPHSRATTTRSARISRRSTHPELFGNSPHSWFGPQPGNVAGVAAVFAGAAHPADSRLFPADVLLLPRRVLQSVLGAIRRRAPSGSRARRYWGEHSFPLVLQNIHRYMLFLVARASCSSWYSDVWKALWFTDPAPGTVSFGVGVGTLVLAANCRPARA